MKNLLQQTLLVLFLTGIIASCKFGSDGDQDRRPEDLETVTEALHNTFFSFEVLGGSESEEFRLENDGMHGIYGLSRTDVDRLDGNNLTLFQCIQNTNPSIPQLVRIRTATNSFSDCRNSNSLAYRQAVNQILLELAMNRRRLVDAMMTGSIAPQDLREELNKLRVAAHASVLREKRNHSDKFRACLGGYIESLNGILTPAQWNQFRSCVTD